MNKPLKIIFVVIAIVIIGSVVWFFSSERGTKNEITDREQQLRNLKEDISSQIPRSTQSQEEIEEIDRAGRLWFEENRTRLYENCAKYTTPPNSDDSGYNPIKKILTIYWWDGTLQQNMSIELPYEPETGFAGCSDPAKEILKHIQQTQVPL